MNKKSKAVKRERTNRPVGKAFYLRNPHLKAVNVVHEFTPEQQAEWVKCAGDPIYFIKNYVKIINIDHGLVPFEMWDFQERMVNTFDDNRFSICKLPRQTGKSTTVCSYFLWCILFNKSYACAILANKGDLARQLLDKVRKSYENLPLWIQQGVVVWNKGYIELENGSSIIATATSSSAARGTSKNAVLLDEFAFVERNMQEEFFNSVYPIISSGLTSKVIIVSTPNGIGNMFYKMWMEAVGKRSKYAPIEINWWDVPGRDEQWKKDTIANTSQRQFDQEFACEFLGSSNTLIDPQYIRAMAFKVPEQSKSGLDILIPPIEGHVYSIICDTSRGLGLDASAFVVVDITELPYLMVAKYKDNEVSPLLYPSVIFNTAKAYNGAFVMVEINDNGQQVASILYDDLEYDNLVFIGKDPKAGQRIGQGFGGLALQQGVKTSKPVKRLGCTLLKNLVENGKLVVNDIDTIGELSTFVQVKDSYEAEVGCHDDLAMCLVLFAWMINQEYFKQVTNKVLRSELYSRQAQQIEEDLVPFGIILDGTNDGELGHALKIGYGSNTTTVYENDSDFNDLLRS